jgi:hypothetical protein
MATSASGFRLHSGVSLLFEPQLPSQVELRAQLRTGIRVIVPNDGKCLYAAHATARLDSFDLENVLFYNIGAANFAHIARNAIRFELAPRLSSGHEWSYALEATECTFKHWRLSEAVVKWNKQPIANTLSGGTKAGVYWRAIKSAQVTLHTRELLGQFALRIRLRAPLGPRAINLAGLMKPLLDGLIAGFHSHGKEIEQELLLRIASQIGPAVSEKQIRQWMTAAGPLGARILFGKSGWNPRDNDCVAVELMVERESQNTCWSWSESLHGAERM